jgi:hypothetical protein
MAVAMAVETAEEKAVEGPGITVMLKRIIPGIKNHLLTKNERRIRRRMAVPTNRTQRTTNKPICF